MLEKISTGTIEAIFDTLPLDLTFVDDTDTVRYYSKGNERIFRRTPAVIGRKVQDCHPQKSLHKVEQVVSELKSGFSARLPLARSGTLSWWRTLNTTIPAVLYWRR